MRRLRSAWLCAFASTSGQQKTENVWHWHHALVNCAVNTSSSPSSSYAYLTLWSNTL